MIKSCPLRMMAVASDPLARFCLRAQLSTLGYLVVAEAADSQEAVSLARQLLPDVAVIDVDMPNRDGLEASRLIDREWLCPIVLLGDYGKAEWMQAVLSRSAVEAYLVKPVNERDLEPAVELALARFQQIDGLVRETMRLKRILGIYSMTASELGRSPQEARELIQQEVIAREVTLGKVA